MGDENSTSTTPGFATRARPFTGLTDAIVSGIAVGYALGESSGWVPLVIALLLMGLGRLADRSFIKREREAR